MLTIVLMEGSLQWTSYNSFAHHEHKKTSCRHTPFKTSLLSRRLKKDIGKNTLEYALRLFRTRPVGSNPYRSQDRASSTRSNPNSNQHYQCHKRLSIWMLTCPQFFLPRSCFRIDISLRPFPGGFPSCIHAADGANDQESRCEAQDDQKPGSIGDQRGIIRI